LIQIDDLICGARVQLAVPEGFRDVNMFLKELEGSLKIASLEGLVAGWP